LSFDLNNSYDEIRTPPKKGVKGGGSVGSLRYCRAVVGGYRGNGGGSDNRNIVVNRKNNAKVSNGKGMKITPGHTLHRRGIMVNGKKQIRDKYTTGDADHLDIAQFQSGNLGRQ